MSITPKGSGTKFYFCDIKRYKSSTAFLYKLYCEKVMSGHNSRELVKLPSHGSIFLVFELQFLINEGWTRWTNMPLCNVDYKLMFVVFWLDCNNFSHFTPLKEEHSYQSILKLNKGLFWKKSILLKNKTNLLQTYQSYVLLHFTLLINVRVRRNIYDKYWSLDKLDVNEQFKYDYIKAKA